MAMRLLLVDDERLILEELITITDWKRIGIDHIETAGNVEQAKGIIQSRRPDIIPVSYTHLDVYKRQV